MLLNGSPCVLLSGGDERAVVARGWVTGKKHEKKRTPKKEKEKKGSEMCSELDGMRQGEREMEKDRAAKRGRERERERKSAGERSSRILNTRVGRGGIAEEETTRNI